MKWIDAMEDAHLKEGAREVVQVEGRSILLLRHRGEVLALAAQCPHMGAPLQNGRLTGDGGIVCPWHRSAFDLHTGDVKDWTPWPPAVGKLLGAVRRERALPVYRVKIEDGRIWVEIE